MSSPSYLTLSTKSIKDLEKMLGERGLETKGLKADKIARLIEANFKDQRTKLLDDLDHSDESAIENLWKSHRTNTITPKQSKVSELERMIKALKNEIEKDEKALDKGKEDDLRALQNHRREAERKSQLQAEKEAEAAKTPEPHAIEPLAPVSPASPSHSPSLSPSPAPESPSSAPEEHKTDDKEDAVEEVAEKPAAARTWGWEDFEDIVPAQQPMSDAVFTQGTKRAHQDDDSDDDSADEKPKPKPKKAKKDPYAHYSSDNSTIRPTLAGHAFMEIPHKWVKTKPDIEHHLRGLLRSKSDGAMRSLLREEGIAWFADFGVGMENENALLRCGNALKGTWFMGKKGGIHGWMFGKKGYGQTF